MTIVTGGLGGGPIVTGGYGGFITQVVPVVPSVANIVKTGIQGGTYYPQMVSFDDEAFWNDFGDDKNEWDGNLDDEFDFELDAEKAQAMLVSKEEEVKDMSQQYAEMIRREHEIVDKLKNQRLANWEQQDKKRRELFNLLLIVRKEKIRVKKMLDVVRAEKMSARMLLQSIVFKLDQLKKENTRKEAIENQRKQNNETVMIIKSLEVAKGQEKLIKLQKFKNMVLMIVGGVIVGYILYKMIKEGKQDG